MMRSVTSDLGSRLMDWVWRGVRLGCSACVLLAPGLALAAGDVSTGGYHDAVLQAVKRQLVGAPLASANELRLGDVAINVDARGDDAGVTGFTPRFGGLGYGLANLDAADGARLGLPAGSAGRDGQWREVRIGPAEAGSFAGLEVDWSAIAELEASTQTIGSGNAGAFRLGGEFALSGLRVDASFGQDARLVGVDGSLMTAGLAYDFGPLDARVSYSLAADPSAIDTSLVTVGSQLRLRPGLVVQGDLAYSEAEDGSEATAGLVSIKLNF